MRNPIQELLAKQAAASGRRTAAATNNVARVATPVRGKDPVGVFPGEVTAALGADCNGHKVYSVQILSGWEKSANGPVIRHAFVSDDTAADLGVGAKVCVALNPPAPPLIVSGGSGITVGDVGVPVWYYGWLNNSGT